MADPVKTEEKDLAPHGRDENGEPLAPFGLNLDGTPRKSNRGARPGQPQGGGKAGKATARPMKAATSPKKDAERKAALLQLAQAFIVVPMIAASAAPPVVSRLGQKQADALAADAYILHDHLPAVADGLIVLSQSKPGVLAWLDQAEDNAPYLALGMAGVQLALALVSNHRSTGPEADAARQGMARAARQFIGVDPVTEHTVNRVAEQVEKQLDPEGNPPVPENPPQDGLQGLQEPSKPADPLQYVPSPFVGS